MELLQTFTASLASLIVIAAILAYFGSRFIKSQSNKAQEQEKLDDTLQTTLQESSSKVAYFDKKRLDAYQSIRKHIQRARDLVRMIERQDFMLEYRQILNELIQINQEILNLLYEHALLLEYDGNYDLLHSFKNNLWSITGTLKDLKLDSRIPVEEHSNEFKNFYISYEEIVAAIRIQKTNQIS